MLSIGVDGSHVDKAGVSPIHIAASDGNVEMIKLLHSHGVDMNAGRDVGKSPLILAATHNNLSAIQTLLEMGVNVDSGASGGVSVMHHAAAAGATRAVELLHSFGLNIDSLDEFNKSPQCHAASNGHVDTVLALEHLGADASYLRQQKALLPRAAFQGHVELIKVLISHFGITANASSHTDDPVHMAVQGGHLDVLRVLCEAGGVVNNKAGNCYPLHWAAENNDVKILRYLAEQGADLQVRMDVKESTALHIAAQNGNREAVKVLFELGADLCSLDADGYTPAHIAVFADKNCVEIVKLFHELGADMGASNSCGVTLIGSAIFNDNWDVARLLHKWGYDANHTILVGDSPLMTAVINNRLEAVKFILRELQSDVNFAGKGGWTAMMCAISIKEPRIEIIAELLENGADIDACNDDGTTAMTLLTAIHPQYDAISDLILKFKTAGLSSTRIGVFSACRKRKIPKKKLGRALASW
jgi:ankyrin repeat protein